MHISLPTAQVLTVRRCTHWPFLEPRVPASVRYVWLEQKYAAVDCCCHYSTTRRTRRHSCLCRQSLTKMWHRKLTIHCSSSRSWSGGHPGLWFTLALSHLLPPLPLFFSSSSMWATTEQPQRQHPHCPIASGYPKSIQEHHELHLFALILLDTRTSRIELKIDVHYLVPFSDSGEDSDNAPTLGLLRSSTCSWWESVSPRPLGCFHPPLVWPLVIDSRPPADACKMHTWTLHFMVTYIMLFSCFTLFSGIHAHPLNYPLSSGFNYVW
jgi:hypothetical protein